eukprot:gnl/MRDRNA2_/MRDRNA2_191067_c0_seq1.p1 gnl/MRDRNA2_/MRDRNA2_191067_c0~~gnl/MRDRNA2_/MRDRNA2_191067_c0_seq1.p1  ORF type:complete len:358 (+),score=61.64 gnl/MRDRNA2_/MRDRNA2_191067_c0_seq1:76-1149(+)
MHSHFCTFLVLTITLTGLRSSTKHFVHASRRHVSGSSRGRGISPTKASEAEVPSDATRAQEFYQCDRQCRWHFGFFNRRIVGLRRAWVGLMHHTGRFCKCFEQTDSGLVIVGGGELIPLHEEKQFDSLDTWSGTGQNGFDSPYVCVAAEGGRQATMLEKDAEEAGEEILHCGKCAACSSKTDIAVLARTREWITEVMTRVSTKFAAPWGHHKLPRLSKDLFDLEMNFSMTRNHGDDYPSCMECWTDNIMCDSMTCKEDCIMKFFDPANQKTQITGQIHFWNLNAKCLKCDEMNCGAEFIKCAGANRRSTGMESDIARPERQKCKVGMYYGKPLSTLPTAPKPTVAQIDAVDNANRDL